MIREIYVDTIKRSNKHKANNKPEGCNDTKTMNYNDPKIGKDYHYIALKSLHIYIFVFSGSYCGESIWKEIFKLSFNHEKKTISSFFKIVQQNYFKRHKSYVWIISVLKFQN